ncbi:hypothetical protein VULLAG_LOCUS15878 [Vulpes lagopus]
MTWGILSGGKYTAVLRVSPGARTPEWVNFQDKFQKRVRVLPEDEQPDPGGHWAVPGSGLLHERKTIRPGFPPDCVW